MCHCPIINIKSEECPGKIKLCKKNLLTHISPTWLNRCSRKLWSFFCLSCDSHTLEGISSPAEGGDYNCTVVKPVHRFTVCGQKVQCILVSSGSNTQFHLIKVTCYKTAFYNITVDKGYGLWHRPEIGFSSLLLYGHKLLNVINHEDITQKIQLMHDLYR